MRKFFCHFFAGVYVFVYRMLVCKVTDIIKKALKQGFSVYMVELRGLEPLTSTLPA